MKLVVTIAKAKIFVRLCVELEKKSENKKLYVKNNQGKRNEGHDLDQMKCIKDENSKVRVEEALIRQR